MDSSRELRLPSGQATIVEPQELPVDPLAAKAGSVDEEKLDTAISPDGSSNDIRETNDDLRQQAWGKHGKIIVWVGIAVMWTAFELDFTLLYNYQNYSLSSFSSISLLGALSTSGIIVSAVLKPSIAKISDVLGRAETYALTILLYIISYILCASARSFSQYVVGYIIYCIGQTGLQVLNQIIVADLTSARFRGLINSLVTIPFMIIPWTSAFIVDAVLATIGWRWGIGMFAIIMPLSSFSILIPLILYQRRLAFLGISVCSNSTLKLFLSQIDILGATLLTAAAFLILLPIALAGNTSNHFRTPWVPACLAVGCVCLLILPLHQRRTAHPILPPAFFRNKSLVLAFIIGLLDAFAYSVTHTYLYAYSTVVHNFSPRDATFLTYTAGATQVAAGLFTGWIMWKLRRYKHILIFAVMVRLVGYGIMLRLRGSQDSDAELFISQVIQGLGSGVVGTVVIVVAQVAVTREHLAQSTALELLGIYLGNALGASVAGAVYTNMFKHKLGKYLPASTPQEVTDRVYSSITNGVPAIGTAQRAAVNNAYGDVLRYMIIAALGASAIPMVCVWFMPDLKLNDGHNMAEDSENKTSTTTKDSGRRGQDE